MIETVVVWRGSPSDLATDVFDLIKTQADREAFLDALAKKIGCSKTALHDKIIREKEQVIEKLAAELDARKIDKKVIARADHLLHPNEQTPAVCTCGPGTCKKTCPACSRGECPEKKTPADRLADIAERFIGGEPRLTLKDIKDAISDYRSTRNGVGMTMDRAFGTPPDPILVARHLLDCLTGGALASLICMVRDTITCEAKKPSAYSWLKTADLASFTSHLRALGERVE